MNESTGRSRHHGAIMGRNLAREKKIALSSNFLKPVRKCACSRWAIDASQALMSDKTCIMSYQTCKTSNISKLDSCGQVSGEL